MQNEILSSLILGVKLNYLLNWIYLDSNSWTKSSHHSMETNQFRKCLNINGYSIMVLLYPLELLPPAYLQFTSETY